MRPPRAIDLATSWAASALRLGLGRRASHAGPRPAKALELYEFEGCPFCRKVREALTMLDLSVLIRPCPRGGPTFRPRVLERGGRAMFPFLVDPNVGAALYQSSDIIAHLYLHYGARAAPWWLRTDLTVPLGSASSVLRPFRGLRYRRARMPARPLELYGFEASPHCRPVREVLCELELPYRLVNVGKGSPERRDLRSRSGRVQVPWLHDPNTGHCSFDSAKIVRYLEETYAYPGRPTYNHRA